ncbi:hypothetical protein HOV93_27910 [Planctomycetes bacterium FF15]|uniref:Uncharacterized protein n=1 Tax=Bremerella alba TaxID=980252 RepID=A0A7V8V616_9BACT|nr:hypothetical protein [Bremerella alba]
MNLVGQLAKHFHRLLRSANAADRVHKFLCRHQIIGSDFATFCGTICFSFVHRLDGAHILWRYILVAGFLQSVRYYGRRCFGVILLEISNRICF